MICKVCGSEFNIENFDVCPYCLTPAKVDDEDKQESEAIQQISEVKNEDQTVFQESVNTALNPIENNEIGEDDYRVAEEDLLEERTEEKEVLIDELGLSVRAVNAFRRAKINTLNELIGFLAENDISDLKNVGEKTVREIEEMIEKLSSGELEIVRACQENDEVSETYIFENISSDLDCLSINGLVALGLSKKLVSHFLKCDIKCCGSLRNLSKKELAGIIGCKYVDRLPAIATILEKDTISLLQYIMDKYRNSREHNVFLRRAKGETLQEIADNPGEEYDVITRERVRQIERNYARTIMPFVRELLYLIKGGNDFVTVQDIIDIFDDDAYNQILLHVIKGLEDFEYFDFAELFVEKADGKSMEQHLLSLIAEIVNDGIDIYENLEVIEEVLSENKFDYIDLEAIISLLKKNNYNIYGSFVAKGKSNYSAICMYIIKKYFPNGIKFLQSESEQSEDSIYLRQIVDERYTGLSIPSSDRALCSTLVRCGLVLRGRGMYISPENITIDESLLSEIKNYIDSKDTNKLFYNEIYSCFEGALSILCGVDNHNYLHGILSLRYPYSYEYKRDYLLKNGAIDAKEDSISDRIYNYICSIGRPISKTELEHAFRGFSNVMLTMPFVNDSRLLQWDYNYYACMGILDITKQDIEELKKIIYELLDNNQGYISDMLLYDRVLEHRPEFIQKNQINSEMNLHYIVAALFSEEMDFRRPHICKEGVITPLSTQNVILYLLGNPDYFTYDQYSEICEKMKWSNVTTGMVLRDIEEDYVRISIDKYVKKSVFTLNQEVIDGVKMIIEHDCEDGILPLLNMGFDEFPEWDNEWNEFAVETVVRKYYPDFTVVQPSRTDRRVQRGIIVRKDKNLTTYSQVVAYKMNVTGNTIMTESQFLSFLVLNNLAHKVIPNELANSDNVKKEGDYYCVIPN